jgi:hypothetical protein
MAAVIARGLVAGLVAGFAAGIYYLVVGEPLIDQAIALEAPSGEPELFSREAQRLGLLAATSLYGISLGGLFAVAYGLIAPRLRSGTPWERSVRLAAAAFLGLWLVPFLKYPSNPPAVGEPATAELRANLYLLLVAVSIALVGLAYFVARRLEDRGLAAHVRLPLVVGAWALAVAVVFSVLPDNPDPAEIPATLLWDMRLASAGGQLILWALLGAGFGGLLVRWLERAGTSHAAGDLAALRR